MKKDTKSLPIHRSVDDVLIRPQYTELSSRSHVSVSVDLDKFPTSISLPLTPSNMSSIQTEELLIGCLNRRTLTILHRFMSVNENTLLYKKLYNYCIEYKINTMLLGVSVGVGVLEVNRALALMSCGARTILIDVAHGAQRKVVEMCRKIRESRNGDKVFLIVGNFANVESIKKFEHECFTAGIKLPDMYKVGIGGGSVCKTRVKTGSGEPHFESVLECSREGYNVICDGGVKTPGDVAKMIAAGAKLVMSGALYAKTYESRKFKDENKYVASLLIIFLMFAYNLFYFNLLNVILLLLAYLLTHKLFGKENYKGSAFLAAPTGFKTSEGGEVTVNQNMTLREMFDDVEGGLRSALTYSNSPTLEDFSRNAIFINVSSSTAKRNDVHNNG